MYNVIVSNIGNIQCSTIEEALTVFNDYVEQSKKNYGRASGSTVTLFVNDNIEKEHIGNIEE